MIKRKGCTGCLWLKLETGGVFFGGSWPYQPVDPSLLWEHLEKEKKSKQPINVSQNTRHCQQVIGGPPGQGAGWYQHTIASLQLVNYFSGTHAVAMPLSSAKTEI